MGIDDSSHFDLVPYIDNYVIRKRAQDFLGKYNASGVIPVDFEEIIELQLKIRIVPVCRLKDLFHIEAYMNHDFTMLTVDNQAYESNSDRLTFTYAHELGHMFLHSHVYQQAPAIQNAEDYLTFLNNISDTDWRHMETQANKFAAEVVFPHDVYMTLVNQLIAQRGGEYSINMIDLRDILLEISRLFNVTETCALVQFQKTHTRMYKIVTQG